MWFITSLNPISLLASSSSTQHDVHFVNYGLLIIWWTTDGKARCALGARLPCDRRVATTCVVSSGSCSSPVPPSCRYVTSGSKKIQKTRWRWPKRPQVERQLINVNGYDLFKTVYPVRLLRSIVQKIFVIYCKSCLVFFCLLLHCQEQGHTRSSRNPLHYAEKALN